MNIKDAYVFSKRELNRSSTGLVVETSYVVSTTGQKETLLVKGQVSGGSTMHRCMLDLIQTTDKEVRVLNERTKTRVRVSKLKRGQSCRVHCNCADFQFTFYPAIKQDKSNIKVFEPVESKGTGKVRAIKEIGICKHLMALVDDLRETGIII